MKETNLIYGMCKKCAMEERFGLKKDIRGPVLPFVHLLLFYHGIHSLFTWLSATRQSHSFSHDLILLSFSLNTILYYYCLY